MNALRQGSRMVGRSAFATTTRSAVPAQQRRNMGGHVKHWSEYEGLEMHIRKFAPTDAHMACVILGFYVSLFGAAKIGGALFGSDPVPPAATAASGGSGSGLDIPDVESPEFEKFMENEANVEKYIAAMATEE